MYGDMTRAYNSRDPQMSVFCVRMIGNTLPYELCGNSNAGWASDRMMSVINNPCGWGRRAEQVSRLARIEPMHKRS